MPRHRTTATVPLAVLQHRSRRLGSPKQATQVKIGPGRSQQRDAASIPKKLVALLEGPPSRASLAFTHLLLLLVVSGPSCPCRSPPHNKANLCCPRPPTISTSMSMFLASARHCWLIAMPFMRALPRPMGSDSTPQGRGCGMAYY